MKKIICAMLFMTSLAPLGAIYIDSETGPTEFKQSWRCPYCRQICEIGRSCKNPHCPSKYPDMS